MGRTVGLSEEQIQDFEVIKRKYKCDSLVSFILFVVNYDEGIAHSKSFYVLRDIIIYHLTFL
jgi:hypothetical protein